MEIKHCPIETAVKHIGRKWSINIIRDLLMGQKKFKEFLEKNPDLSTKMLSQRLRELEKDGIVEKAIVSTTPIKIEYKITEKGKDLDKVLYELAMFSFRHYSKEIVDHPHKLNQKACSLLIRQALGME